MCDQVIDPFTLQENKNKHIFNVFIEKHSSSVKKNVNKSIVTQYRGCTLVSDVFP